VVVFAFWLLFQFSPETFIALFSFVVISISLTFKTFITNAVSGAIMLTSQQFDIGDLIETNGIQGIVNEITLNYTEIQEFDGVPVIIPNSNVYGSILTKFTHKKYINLQPPKPGASEQRIMKYRKYLKYINKLLADQPKTTKYVKSVELLKSVDPETLDTHLKPIFDKYQEIFDIRPDFVVDMTRYGRCRINLYISAKRPELIVNNTDAFLRDIIFQLYNKVIYQDWENYLKSLKDSHKNIETPAKKAPAKKAPAKKASAKKTPAKKAPAKKTLAKKTPAKKASAKKASAKKAPAKKTPAKKTPAKKTPAKKTHTKKEGDT
jgi:hypothetical protein